MILRRGSDDSLARVLFSEALEHRLLLSATGSVTGRGDGQSLSGYNSGAVYDYIPGPYVFGTVFDDLNDSLRRDSIEGGLGDVTVYNDINFNGVFDPGESSTQTNANGSYLLSGFASDQYHLRTILPKGWTQTVSSINGYLPTSGGVDEDIAVTESLSVNTSIRGTIYNDVNGNGKRDTGESVATFTRVYNDANNNNVMDAGEITTLTDSTGLYQLNNLSAGSYKIRQILLSGWTQTTPANNYGWSITLSKLQNVSGKDFGRRQTSVAPNASIAGTVFNDLDGDGVKDSNEASIAGITVYNDANNNSVKDANELTAATSTSGYYSFAGLAAGSYKIRQILQNGWSQTTPSNNYGWTITLGTNQALSGKNFGTKQNVVTGGKISGTIFNDLDGDGVKDSNETGVGAGWTVYIDLDNDSILDANELRTTTDTNGNWTLSSLAAGTYKVRQVLQAGWKQTTPSNNYGLNVTLGANQNVSGRLFGSKKIA